MHQPDTTGRVDRAVQEWNAKQAQDAWRQALRDHEDRVIDTLLSVPKDRLTVRSTPQYTFRCKRCGCTRFFECREDMQAFKEIHRPRLMGPMGENMGRGYNCDLRQITTRNRKGRTVQYWIGVDNILPGLRDEAGLVNEYARLWEKINDVRQTEDALRVEGEHSLGEESGGVGAEDSENGGSGTP